MNRPIQHQKQGNQECALASIAMLTGKPLELIRRRALGISKTATWYEATLDPDTFWRAIVYLVRFYNLENCYCTAGMLPGATPVKTHPVTPNCPKFVGRGQLVYRMAIGAHSVVVDNSMVYDSNKEGPVPLAQYWAETVVGFWNATHYWTKMAVEQEQASK